MKIRKTLIHAIASAVAIGIAIPVNLKFLIPIILPSYGWLITGIGAFAVTCVTYLVIYLPLFYFSYKKS